MFALYKATHSPCNSAFIVDIKWALGAAYLFLGVIVSSIMAMRHKSSTCVWLPGILYLGWICVNEAIANLPRVTCGYGG